RFIGSEFIARARVPCSLDHGAVSIFGVEVRSAHDTRRELDLNNVDARFGGIARDNRGLETKSIRFVDPFELFRCNADYALGGFLTQRNERHEETGSDK